MPKHLVKTRLKHNGRTFEPGSQVELTAEQAKTLVGRVVGPALAGAPAAKKKVAKKAAAKKKVAKKAVPKKAAPKKAAPKPAGK